MYEHEYEEYHSAEHERGTYQVPADYGQPEEKRALRMVGGGDQVEQAPLPALP